MLSVVRRMQLAINRAADFTDSHGFRFSVEKFHVVLFPMVIWSYGLEDRLLGMIFDERLTWAPHLRSLGPACQSPLDLLRHLSHTTWSADRTTLLHLHLVLVRSKLDYGVHGYCTGSPCTLRILDPIQN